MIKRGEMSSQFDTEAAALVQRLFVACNPEEFGADLTQQQYMMVIGAALTHSIAVHVEFLAQFDKDFARQVLEAHEADLVQLRIDHGWMSD